MNFEGKYYGKAKLCKVIKSGKIFIEEYNVNASIVLTDSKTILGPPIITQGTYLINIDFNCNKRIETLTFLCDGKLTGIGSGNSFNIFEFINEELYHNLSSYYNGDYLSGSYKLNRMR